jgi:hypothetical protein
MRRLLTVLSFGWFIAGPPSAKAGIVFDSLTGATVPSFGPGCCQIGDEITLGGTDRYVSLLRLGVFTQRIDLTVGIEMAIYANNGFGGAPGTLLWQSAALTGLLIPANATEISIEVPNIAVPNVITVTSHVLSSTPAALGRLLPGPPTIGSLDAAWLENSPGVWVLEVSSFEFAVQVEAVPEPPFSVLIAASLLGVALVRFDPSVAAVGKSEHQREPRHDPQFQVGIRRPEYQTKLEFHMDA